MEAIVSNFSLGFCASAAVICIVIMANYYTLKRIKTRSGKAFQALMAVTLISALLNLALVLLNLFGAPFWSLEMMNMITLISTHSGGLVFMLYVLAECYENRLYPKFFTVFTVGLIIAIGVSMGLYAFRSTFGYIYEYTLRGIMYLEHYAAFGITCAYVIRNRKLLSRRKIVNIFFYVGFSVVSVIFYGLTGVQGLPLAQALAVMLIFATLRNPKDEIDGLTETFNANAFKVFMRHQMASRRSLYLFVMGIRNSTVLNAQWGQKHEEVLKECATRLKGITGKNTYVYRTSEARFAAVFYTDAQYNRFVAGYKQVMLQPFYIEGTPVIVDLLSLLIKLPDVANKLADVENILKFYSDKHSAGEIIVATREAVESVERREKVDYAIQKSLRNHSFQVYYQPIFDLKNKKFNCCEALIRLRDDELGFIPPDEFIPISESNGTIVEVGREVVTEVCKFIKDQKPENYGVEYIDVNLSIIQCLQPDIIEDIKSILKQYGVPRGMVNLEITETASAKSYAMLQQRLNELHSNGFTISLDDFGTGFSSVEFLISFPFDIVKLDRSLVWAYMGTKKYETILQHYMPMLHSLGTKIVAEGVETEEMVNALGELGCDYLQGYYYSRPLPKNDYIDFLHNHNQLLKA